MLAASREGPPAASVRGRLPMTALRPPLSSAPPTIWGSNETSEVAVVEGHPVRFLCEARGVPTPDITWLKDGDPLLPNAEAVYTRGGRQLQLEKAQGSDAGIYTCKASNPVGVVEKATRLEVYGEQPGVSAGTADPSGGRWEGLWAVVASVCLWRQRIRDGGTQGEGLSRLVQETGQWQEGRSRGPGGAKSRIQVPPGDFTFHATMPRPPSPPTTTHHCLLFIDGSRSPGPLGLFTAPAPLITVQGPGPSSSHLGVSVVGPGLGPGHPEQKRQDL